MKLTIDPRIDEKQASILIKEEVDSFAKKGKAIGEIEMTIENDEIVIKSYEVSPIKRIRRITGYLSEEHNFNSSKHHELHDRKTHVVHA